MSEQTLTFKGKRIKLKAAPESEPVFDNTLPPEGPWTAAQLYGRSQGNRRVMLLELMAWAIHQAESCETRADFAAFEQELRDVRAREWGSRPWSSATDPEHFRAHVKRMADEFTAIAPGRFTGRERQRVD